MKNPIAFFPFTEYRLSLSIQPNGMMCMNAHSYQDFITHVNFRLCQDFLVLAYVILPNQCHFIVQSRAMLQAETVRDYSSALRRSIHGTFQYFQQGELPIKPTVLPIPQEGIDRARILKASIEHFHALPFKMGLVEEHEVWPYSSCTWIQNEKFIHPLSKWLHDFLC
jgi:hypothetical protein